MLKELIKNVETESLKTASGTKLVDLPAWGALKAAVLATVKEPDPLVVTIQLAEEDTIALGDLRRMNSAAADTFVPVLVEEVGFKVGRLLRGNAHGVNTKNVESYHRVIMLDKLRSAGVGYADIPSSVKLQEGDEYRASPGNGWTRCSAWVGRTPRDLNLQGQFRRPLKPAVAITGECRLLLENLVSAAIDECPKDSRSAELDKIIREVIAFLEPKTANDVVHGTKPNPDYDPDVMKDIRQMRIHDHATGKTYEPCPPAPKCQLLEVYKLLRDQGVDVWLEKV